ncbi:hypothetical protein [Streptomyces sp. NPDC057253]|uniref:hypothetical protein n=1 Tax=Streptomyces sp. NPDC057253 TaxID=3346069 RepID=UPI0036304B83
MTSAGVSAGIDMALHLVDRFEGTELARTVAQVLDYPWHSPGSAPDDDKALREALLAAHR